MRAASIDLASGEVLLRKAIARAYSPIWSSGRVAFFADGLLHLTNQRLVWRRTWLTVPFVPVRPFDIDLRDVRECTVVGASLTMLLGAGGGFIVKTSDRQFNFLIAKQRAWPPAFWFSKNEAQEWRAAVLGVIG